MTVNSLGHSFVRPAVRRVLVTLLLPCWCVGVGGCVRPGAMAGGDADASLSAVRVAMRDMNAALVQMRTEMRAGRDIQTNDPWTLRLLGAGLLLLGLSYPVGKLVWTSLGGDRLRRGGAEPWPMASRRPGGPKDAVVAAGKPAS